MSANDHHTPDGRDPLDELARRLPEEIEPRDDLWPGIAARLRDREAKPGALARFLSALTGRGPAWGVAAAAIVVALWALVPRSPEPIADTTGSISPEMVAVLHDLETECDRMHRDLIDHIGDGLSREEAEATDVLLANLVIIRSAIAESRAAFEVNPQRVDLTRTVAEDYRERLSLLRTAARLTTTPPGEPAGGTEPTDDHPEGDRS